MIEAAFVGVMLGIGLTILFRGLNPPDATLQERIDELSAPMYGDDFDDVEPESFDALREQLAVRLLRATKGDKIADTLADVAVSRRSVEAFAIDKLSGGLGAGIIFVGGGIWFGLISTIMGGIIVGAAGAAVGYSLPDFEVRRQAAAGRIEFEEALTAFVGLVSVSMSGGGGLNTAMADSAAVGRGWVFETLLQTLNDAQLRSEPAWRSLDQLGRRLQVDGLIELAGALGLAGDSGARITETLIARAESGRKRMIADARAEAERQTANLGLPVGTLLIGWVGFLGYPAVVNVIQGLT
jgi:hypothetical protein